MNKDIYKEYYKWFKWLTNILNKSYPFFIDANTQWSEEKNKNILILWKETFWYPSKHWCEKVKDYWRYYDNKSISDIQKLNEICCKLFGFPSFSNEDSCVLKHFNSPFWRFFKTVRNIYPDYNIIWSNLIKFDVNERALNNKTIKQIWKEIIITKHIDLLIKEINIINPKKIIILSKQNDQNSVYNKIIEGITKKNKQFWLKLDIIKYEYINNNKIPIYQIYHPNYLTRKGIDFNDIIELIN